MPSVSIRPVCGTALLHILEPPAEAVVDGVVVRNQRLRSGFREAVVTRLADSYRGDLEAGQRVYLRPYCGREVVVNGERLAFVRDADVAAVLEG